MAHEYLITLDSTAKSCYDAKLKISGELFYIMYEACDVELSLSCNFLSNNQSVSNLCFPCVLTSLMSGASPCMHFDCWTSAGSFNY